MIFVKRLSTDSVSPKSDISLFARFIDYRGCADVYIPRKSLYELLRSANGVIFYIRLLFSVKSVNRTNFSIPSTPVSLLNDASRTSKLFKNYKPSNRSRALFDTSSLMSMEKSAILEIVHMF